MTKETQLLNFDVQSNAIMYNMTHDDCTWQGLNLAAESARNTPTLNAIHQ